MRRWLFAAVVPGLAALARTIRNPREPIKLCGTGEALLAALPPGWRLHAPGHLMTGPPPPAHALPAGYALALDRAGAAARVEVRDASGAIAASGHAGAGAAYVYDRIVTVPEHRRRGLGRVVMGALGAGQHGRRGLLVATDQGRALYEALGWMRLSPYATASFAAG